MVTAPSRFILIIITVDLTIINSFIALAPDKNSISIFRRVLSTLNLPRAQHHRTSPSPDPEGPSEPDTGRHLMVARDQRIRERGVGDTFHLSHPVSTYHLKGPVKSLKHTVPLPACLSHPRHVTTNYPSNLNPVSA